MKKILVIAAKALLVLTATSIGAIAKEDKPEDTLKLKQGYLLHVSTVEEEGAKVCFHLTRSNGDIINSVTVLDNDGFSLYNEDIEIVKVERIQVLGGMYSWAIILDNLVQYNEATGKIISEIDRTVLIKPKN